MRTRLARIGAFLFIVLLTFPAQAVTFWEDNFENHLYPNWDTSPCTLYMGVTAPAADGCNPGISIDYAHSGTHSFKSDFSGPYRGGGTNPSDIGQKGTYIYRRHTATDDIYIRFWYRTESYVPCNGTLKTTAKVIYNKTAGTDSGVWGQHCDVGGLKPMVFEMQHNAGPYPYCPFWRSNSSTCRFLNNLSNPTLSNGKWYCIELHMRFGSVGGTDGQVEQWVDGLQTMKHTGITLRADADSSKNKWQSIANYTQAADEGYRYIDDFAVGNTRIGCGDPLPAPAPPQNLSVQ